MVEDEQPIQDQSDFSRYPRPSGRLRPPLDEAGRGARRELLNWLNCGGHSTPEHWYGDARAHNERGPPRR